MRDCDTLQDEYPGMSVRELPELASRLEEVSVNGYEWVRTLRCKVCGQLWEERYEEKGHGEVPAVRKMARP